MTRDDIEELLNELEVDSQIIGISSKVCLAKTLIAHGFTLPKMIVFFEDYLDAIESVDAAAIQIADYESILRRKGILKQQNRGETK